MLSSLAFDIIASARGCSEGFSIEAAIAKKLSSESSLNTIMSVTFGFPSVIVPVLSKTTVLTECNVSKASADLINIP